LAHEVGWKHRDIIGVMEQKRKAEAKVYYDEKLKLAVRVLLDTSVLFTRIVSRNMPKLTLNPRAWMHLQKLKAQAAAQVPAEITQTLAKYGY
jgi:hypothetical protein